MTANTSTGTSAAGCCETPNCEQMLCDLVSAYTNIAAGQGIQEVSWADDTTRWHRGNLAELKKIIVQLHGQCGNAVSAAIAGVSGRRHAMSVCFGESYHCKPTMTNCHQQSRVIKQRCYETQKFSITVSAANGEITGYNLSNLIPAIVATGLCYSSGAEVSAEDKISQIDFGLKPVDGHYTPDGINKIIASTADATLEHPAGGGEWRDLDPTGQEETMLQPGEHINDFNLNVKNGSIVIISGIIWREYIEQVMGHHHSHLHHH